MCLTDILEEIPPRKYDDKTVVTAWKVFKAKGKNVWFPYYHGTVVKGGCYLDSLLPAPVGKWMKAVKCAVPCRLGIYKSGFHVCPTKEFAEFYARGMLSPRIRRVQVRGIRIIGADGGTKTMVADYMRILPTVRKERRKKQCA